MSPEDRTALATAVDSVVAGAGEGAAAALRSLLTRSDAAIATWDTDLRCTWVNDALERYDGIPRARRLGRPPQEALAGDASEPAAVMRRVLSTGENVTGLEYRVPAAGTGRDRALSASFLHLRDAAGRTLGVCLVVEEKSPWAGDRLAVVSEAGARIGTTLDVMRTAQELADFTVPLFADYVTVDLTEAARLGEEPLDRYGLSEGRVPTFRRAGRASIHPGAPESLWTTGDVVYVPRPSPFLQVLSSGRPLLEPTLDPASDAWLDNDPARARKIIEFGMHSLLILPVLARGILLGVAVFVRTENPAPFNERDQLLAEELVARAALSLDNARRYTRERTTALALQHSLLPRHVDGGSAMDVVARYLPADGRGSVGGDWFDVITLPRGRLALVVGDVVGHGIDAAATMGRLRTAVRTLADFDLPPGELLTRLDRTFIRLVEDDEAAGDAVPSMGATCVYAVYDPATRTCSVASAGHPPPAVVRPGGGASFLDVPQGTPLGVGLAPYETAESEVAPGSLLALYSDGLVEERYEDIDKGMRRVREILGRREESLEDLARGLIGSLPAQVPDDDVTLLLARVLQPGHSPSTPRTNPLPNFPSGSNARARDRKSSSRG
ncbi:SpoIIE family protein phosphatase [Streptomyces sp. VNUA74]|uniref:SpoIIE family protein phosphatase n=1 Tax=Streptomyces sp. VNUA74 TaxID=3062685 RepID=UPI00280AB584|nr:SpoIIE family protein phosphatase [Streptomyces sp. VNUA74]WML83228.1 SpoIIE family protein phosphatase [Streptomyces sp. VNUA74]